MLLLPLGVRSSLAWLLLRSTTSTAAMSFQDGASSQNHTQQEAPVGLMLSNAELGIAQLHSVLQITHDALLAGADPDTDPEERLSELRRQYTVVMRNLKESVHSASVMRSVATAREAAVLGGERHGVDLSDYHCNERVWCN